MKFGPNDGEALQNVDQLLSTLTTNIPVESVNTNLKQK